MSSTRSALTMVGGLFVLVVVVTAVGLWRVEASLDDDKARVLALIDQHVNCLYREDIACLQATSSWDQPTMDSALKQARLTHTQLGARGKSEPIKSSWSMRKFNSVTSGTTIMTRVSLATPYEHDSKAWERVEVVEHKGALRLRSYRVHPSQATP